MKQNVTKEELAIVGCENLHNRENIAGWNLFYDYAIQTERVRNGRDNVSCPCCGKWFYLSAIQPVPTEEYINSLETMVSMSEAEKWRRALEYSKGMKQRQDYNETKHLF